MPGAFWGQALFVILVAVPVVVLAKAILDLNASRLTGKFIVGALIAVVLGLSGPILTLLPVKASTGAVCLISPSTYVFGPAGSQQEVDSASNATDRISTQSCIKNARLQTSGAVMLVLLGVSGYGIATRYAARQQAIEAARA